MARPSSSFDGGPRPALKTRARRPFELSSPAQSEPVTPEDDQAPSISNGSLTSNMTGSSTPPRTKSILNLTSPTLRGIYGDREESNTPWGNGAETPAEGGLSNASLSRLNIPDAVFERGRNGMKLQRKSPPREQPKRRTARRGFTGLVLPLIGRNIALFAAGVFYAMIITNLHDRQGIAPVKVDLNRSSWTYLLTWGLVGAVIGQVLPWVDKLWAPDAEEAADTDVQKSEVQSMDHNVSGLEGWMNVVRSISVFVGIAFAIRKLPWQSTLQLSLTLALSNPAVWYLIDRSPPGFVFSTIVALSGTALLLGINPNLVQSHSSSQSDVGSSVGWNNTVAANLTNEELIWGTFSQDTLGTVTWIMSVLFVSSVCFGNIGRRLAT